MQRLARIVLPLCLAALYATLGVIRTVSNALRDANQLKNTVAVLFTLAVAALLTLLARQKLLGKPRVWAALFGAGALYTALIWPMNSPEEKVHFLEYGLVAVLAFFAAPTRFTGFSRYAAAALFTAAAGWVDEGIQALLPSRYYDLRDVAFNATAGVLALLMLAALRWTAGAGTSRTAAP